jgi:flavin-dependent dehydrogenase
MYRWKPEPVWPKRADVRFVKDPAADIPIVFEGDVAVIGGGTAGVVAAVAAAREGARTIVIERLAQLGGCPVTDLMGSYGPMFIDGKYGLVLKGLPYEITERMMRAGGTRHGNMRDVLVGKDGIPYTVPFKPEIMGRVVTEMAQEAGVKILLHTHFSHVLGPKERPEGAVVVNKSGRQAVLARCFVDASGDCDLIRSAGAPVRRQSSRWGLLFRMIHVDFGEVIVFLATKRPWEADPGFMDWLSKRIGVAPEDLKDCPKGLWGGIMDPLPYNHQPADLSRENADLARPSTMEYILNRWKADGFVYNFEMRLLRDEMRRAVDNGDFTLEKDVPGFGKMHSNWDGFAFGAWGPGVALVNACHASWFDPTDGEHVTKAEIEARARCMMTARFLAKYVPGFEKAEMLDMGGQTISRYGIFIDSQGDFDPKKHHEDPGDAVFLVSDTQGRDGDVWHAPFRMLVPKHLDNVLAAGKCAGNAQTIRGILACMGMGQAAGTAAALAARTGTTVRGIDMAELRSRLRAQKVILSLSEAEPVSSLPSAPP